MRSGPAGTMQDEDREEQDALRAAVLDFVRAWPSRYPSAARIAQAVGRPPGEVIEVLEQIKASGEYPESDEGEPPEAPVPGLESWDRAN